MAMRLDNEMLARIDALAAKLSTSYKRTSRSEAIRMCLEYGLPLAESQAEREVATRIIPGTYVNIAFTGDPESPEGPALLAPKPKRKPR